MIKTIKTLIKMLPIDITQNQKYDTQTGKVIARVCSSASCCIDVGCHKGEVLDIMRRYAPDGMLYGVEPIPDMAADLRHKYQDDKTVIIEAALTDRVGTSTFNHVITNPAYSGLLKRSYDRKGEDDREITVRTDRLDNVIPVTEDVHLIKIDVEGGELGVLQGGVETIRRCRPIIIFEHGLGATDHYGVTPELLYDLMMSLGYHVSLMKTWLSNGPAFSKQMFADQYYNKKNYYFIAYPMGGA